MDASSAAIGSAFTASREIARSNSTCSVIGASRGRRNTLTRMTPTAYRGSCSGSNLLSPPLAGDPSAPLPLRKQALAGRGFPRAATAYYPPRGGIDRQRNAKEAS